MEPTDEEGPDIKPLVLPMKASWTKKPKRLMAIRPVRSTADLSRNDWIIDILIFTFKNGGQK
jgi:hypothetical protein